MAILVAGTASGVGKNTIACGLIRIMRESGMSPVPLKPLSIESLPDEAGDLITPSIRAQALAAGVDPHPIMNPERILFSSEGVRCYVNGQLQTCDPVHASRTLRNIDAAVSTLRHMGDLVIEGCGALCETFDSDSLFPVMDKEVASVMLVADAYMGGALAAVIGTLELAPAGWIDRIKAIVFNRLCESTDNSPIPVWKRTLQRRYGVPLVFSMPVMAELYAMSEDLWPMAPGCAVESDIAEVAKTLKVQGGGDLLSHLSAEVLW